MGMNQPFRSSASWNEAVQLLDSAFPLHNGSHGSAQAYLVHFDHLVVIQADGSATALKHPAQFIEAGGNPEAPQSILLEQQGVQVEIEPARCSASVQPRNAGHRMQLLTRIP